MHSRYFELLQAIGVVQRVVQCKYNLFNSNGVKPQNNNHTSKLQSTIAYSVQLEFNH